ncbi:MAG: S46 family peptidase [Candidatus Eisenbacteria bacterium]|nr:S46 family peptidase [Candidatus Eisenbacteria bacterium]
MIHARQRRPRAGIVLAQAYAFVRRGKRLACLALAQALAVACAASWLTAERASADEGMWLFNDPPLELLQEKYGFSPSSEWLAHFMHAACRIDGASGSFISPDGLVITNHHVGFDAIYQLSTAENNLLADGFVASTLAEELPCPGMDVLSLVEIVDVTARVKGAAAEGASAADARDAREKEIAAIEQESKRKTGLESEVVTLYRGGLYHLYKYKRYDDVRLVLAPEEAIANLGEDRDNFEYPRYDLDICLFRVYENGRPARIADYLPVATEPAREGELVFVAGHPASTERLLTLDHMRFDRDVRLPMVLAHYAGMEIALQQFSLRSAEHARMAYDDLLGVQNGRKGQRGVLAGLLDPEIFARKAASEARLRARVAEDPESGATLDDWDRLSASLGTLREFYWEYRMVEENRGFWSDMYRWAHTLVRLAEEREKPNAERLPGYRESDMESLEDELFSDVPVYPALEEAKLTHSLTMLAAGFGADHPFVRAVLKGRSPAARAHELVAGTRLGDAQERRRLAEGGRTAIEAADDPMIALARLVEPHAREVRSRYEDLFESVENESYARITGALFAEYGTSLYPDATFTLRFAFGPVIGIPDQGIAYQTTLGEAFAKYDEYEGRPPYALPARWVDARERIDPATPFNMICTADITGGNSGSPAIDRDGRLVGVIFDGNLDGLVWDYSYSDARGRSVFVAMPAVIEALRKVYGAERLLEELGVK